MKVGGGGATLIIRNLYKHYKNVEFPKSLHSYFVGGGDVAYLLLKKIIHRGKNIPKIMKFLISGGGAVGAGVCRGWGCEAYCDNFTIILLCKFQAP